MRSGTVLVGAFVTASIFAAAACSFTVDGVIVSIAQTDLGDDSAPHDINPADLSELCSPQGPTSACSADGSNLLVCKGTVPAATPCGDGCSSDGQPHCRRLDPGGVAEPADYEQAGLADVVLTQDAVLNTDTGEITATPFERTGGNGVIAGVGFRSVSQANGAGKVGIFSFGSLTVALGKTIHVVGASPLSIVAAHDIDIGGVIDVQGSCLGGSAIAGGGNGGAPKSNNGNPGGGTGGGGGGFGTAMVSAGGGGGGGHGDVGGLGGGIVVMPNAGGAGGPIFGDLTVADPILRGGGGGGAGGGAMGGAGGGGGGVVQLAANGQIVLSNGAGIVAGGCHGTASLGAGAGGGGGAGGTILVEARQVQIEVGVKLSANGGGGAGGGDGKDGDDAPIGEAQAQGGAGAVGLNRGTQGGAGGHTGALFGSPASSPSAMDVYGGGGGGAVGRIALKTKSGALALIGVILSPKLNETSAGHPAPTQLGLVQFK